MSEPALNYVPCPDASGGHRMAYWQWGDPAASHVIVCVHGLTRQGRDFDVLARALCSKALGRIRVVCPDVVGRGKSDWLQDPTDYQIPNYAADMLALLAQLKPATLDWVGTSMGGLIGMVIFGQPGLSGAGPSQGAKQGAARRSSLFDPSNPAQAGLEPRVSAPSGGSVAREAASVGAQSLFPVQVRRLVLNDVGPSLQWQALQRIGLYLGNTGRFESLQQAADAMWAVSTSFGPHTPEQWLALSRHMVKPVGDASGALTLHYDPAIAVPFGTITQESAAQSEAALWQLYDNIKAATLLTRGAQSDLLSPATALAMTQRGPKTRLVEFEGVGHAPTFMANNQVETVASFLLD